MEANEVFIEELNTNDVTEAELLQFEEVEVFVQAEKTEVDEQEDEQEQAETGALIQRFVCEGETQLPEFCIKLESDDEEEEEDEEVDTKPSTSKQTVVNARDVVKVRKYTKSECTDVDVDVIAGGSGGGGSGSNRTQRGGARRRTVLNAALQCMMGEANLSYARGQTEIAEKICLEIIRQNPLAAEPFFTLAEIYEPRDKDKYLNFLTIAAHLNPGDRELWIRITDLHIARKNLDQARNFLTKAIKGLPHDYDLRIRKGRLLEEMGLPHSAKHTYLKMLPFIPPTEANLCLSIAQDVARYFHGLNKTLFALQAMQSAYFSCSASFTLEALNLFMDLLLLQKSYSRVVQILREHTNLHLQCAMLTATGQDDYNTISECIVPEDYVPEFRAKLYVSLIHLNARHLFEYILHTVHAHLETTNESQLDLYIDIAEAFMQCDNHVDAWKLLTPITNAANEDGVECPAFVWLRHAECLHQMQRIDEAIESFNRVVDLAPLCYKARFTLSALLKQQGRHVEAVRALEQPTDEDGLNPRLLYERCLMLHEMGEVEEFLAVGFTLLSRSSLLLRSREELLAISNGINSYNADSIRNILEMRNITEDTDQAMQEYNKTSNNTADLTVHDEFELFKRLVGTAHAHRKYSYAERLCFAMMTTKRFISFNGDLERIIIMSCYFNDDCQLAFSYLREMIIRQQDNMSLWNFLSLMVQKGQELRYHRFLRRLFERVDGFRERRLYLAHYYLHCCSYKYALNEYASLYREQQQPIAALCMAVIFNQLSLQKRVLRKTAAISHAITFAHKYAEWRAECNEAANTSITENSAGPVEQEIHYNIGRIYHQAGMLHLALSHYERALHARHPLIEKHAEYLSLRPEIAFNMHLIYLANGNRVKARQCIHQYCVV